MILYKFAKWMDERNRLARTIHETKGDVSFLVHRKEQVDELMMELASRWMDPNMEETIVPMAMELSELEIAQERTN